LPGFIRARPPLLIGPHIARLTKQAFEVRLAAFYAAVFVVIGIQMPFFPVWLAAKGLTTRETALVLAAPFVVRMIAVPLTTRVVDRFSAIRGALILGSLAAAGGFVAVGFAQGFAGILLCYAIGSLALSPLLPLLDAYALRGLPQRGRAYGPVRVWGSAAFVAANLGAGWLLEIIAATYVVWLLVGALIVAGALSLALRPLGSDDVRPSARVASRGGVLFSPGFLLVALAASLIQASHALFYSFSVIDWTQQGLDATVIGALWATGVLAEIALFGLSAKLPSSIGPLTLLGLGALGAVIRWTAMASHPAALALPFLQCLHGLSFGATFLGSVQIVARIASPRQFATAQGDVSTLAAGLMATATALSGLLYAAAGSRAYVGMALLAALGGGFILLARRHLGKERAMPRPGASPQRSGTSHGSPSPNGQ
jgi:MFS transporter, PPP family, 3-phenylpropionic acid transporter